MPPITSIDRLQRPEISGEQRAKIIELADLIRDGGMRSRTYTEADREFRATIVRNYLYPGPDSCEKLEVREILDRYNFKKVGTFAMYHDGRLEVTDDHSSELLIPTVDYDVEVVIAGIVATLEVLYPDNA